MFPRWSASGVRTQVFFLTILFAASAWAQSGSSAPSSGGTTAASQSGTNDSASSPSDQSSSANPANQSLGEIARRNQEQKADAGQTTGPSKKITNADLPKNPEGYTGPPAEEQQQEKWQKRQANAQLDRQAAQHEAQKERASAMWQQRIQAQQYRVANLQARADYLRAQLHFVNPNAGYESAGVPYNGFEARAVQQLKHMDMELEQQRQKLQDMQDSARRAGVRTSAYEQ